VFRVLFRPLKKYWIRVTVVVEVLDLER